MSVLAQRGLLLSGMSQGVKDIRPLIFTICYDEKCIHVLL